MLQTTIFIRLNNLAKSLESVLLGDKNKILEILLNSILLSFLVSVVTVKNSENCGFCLREIILYVILVYRPYFKNCFEYISPSLLEHKILKDFLLTHLDILTAMF